MYFIKKIIKIYIAIKVKVILTINIESCKKLMKMEKLIKFYHKFIYQNNGNKYNKNWPSIFNIKTFISIFLIYA